MRDVLFILPNGARLMRRDLHSHQVYKPGVIVKTSKGVMVVLKASCEPGEPETVELRFYNPIPKPHVPVSFPAAPSKPPAA